ncbi:hypothetical protein B0H17DRAFT_1111441 [Mycena rosella]|uniref:Uncharacterized protein n=1 Tax=Mycena rosella TaxID=1033263 RepID=A0AAD7FL25_MYCRO|nr:hypothetical protein B0H17DRAFT_1111441 [Mycena rosella]
MAVTPAQKKAIDEVLNALTSATGPPRKRQLAGMFLELVDRNDWPEYYEVIPEPRCLNNIHTMLEKNRYKDALDAYTDLSLVFLNALFYNEPDSQIAIDAQTLKDLLESEWKSKALPTPRDSLPPSSAQKVHDPTPKQTPQPPPPPAAKPIPPPAPLPALAIPSTSTFVYSNPSPAPISPVEAPPPPVYLESESESEPEDLTDDAYDAPGAPTDTQIVRQLERGLPRYAPLLGEDGGWMADVKHERHLEIVQAIKAYRDPAGVKLSTALDASRSRSKTFYTSSRPFDADVARMFECGRRYYLERGGGVAGVGGEDASRTHSRLRSPVLPLAQPLVVPPPLPAPGARTLESVAHKGFVLRPGDYVHVSPATEDAMKAGGRGGRPIVGRVVGCWRDDGDADAGGVSVQWYLPADEISHLMSTTRRTGAIEGEVVQTDKKTHHPLADVLEKVACQHVSSAPRGRPRAPVWYPGWPLYVCGYRYDAVRVGTEGAADAEDKLDLFERPLRLGAQQRRQGVVVDRSVVSAAGVAVTAIEKLPSETKRHFERDPTTGEVLWFPGPPMHVARAPPPRHRLEYLHFLARKYHPQPELEPKPVPMNGHPNGGTGAANGGIGAGEDDPMAGDGSVVAEKDVEMGGSEPPTKRRKLAVEERYVSASERIREVLSAVGDA